MRLNAVKVAMATLVLGSCTLGGYESGDGRYSYLKSELGNVQTDGQANISQLRLDNGDVFAVEELRTMDGAKADTVYRGLIYYQETDGGKARLDGFQASLVCRPFDKKKEPEWKSDPVDVESTWVSENGTYLNAALLVKTGVSEDVSCHSFGIGLEKSEKMAGGHSRHYIRLYHDRGGKPEYYTAKVYLSLPIEGSFHEGDSVSFKINTYSEGIKSIKVRL